MIEPRIVDLNEVIAHIEPMLVRLIPKSVALVFLPGADTRNVRVDSGQFEQIIVNLVVNARDAMPEGGCVTMETRNEAVGQDAYPEIEPGDYVMVSVRDTGVGIDESAKPHIFEPFYTTKEKGVGTGLGLSTVYGIVKQAGGHIIAESDPGAGAEFKIYLPAADGKKESVPANERAAPSPRGTETILIAEDEPSVRTLAAWSLQSFGYHVLTAEDGLQALKVANGNGSHISLLLTDVVMPKMGGKELAKRLQSLNPDIKVLFCSGYAEDVIMHEGVLDPDIAFLPKPFTPSGLAAKVREVLG